MAGRGTAAADSVYSLLLENNFVTTRTRNVVKSALYTLVRDYFVCSLLGTSRLAPLPNCNDCDVTNWLSRELKDGTGRNPKKDGVYQRPII